VGEALSWCFCGGGVGTVSGKSLDAALRSADDSREAISELGSQRIECSGDGYDDDGWEVGQDGGYDCSRWMASFDAFSRMYLRSSSVSPDNVSETSMRRTSVGEP
jgi:hypothetical protein